MTTLKRAGNRPSVPCSACGRLLWWHTSYRPGVSRCRDCRRTARAAATLKPPRAPRPRRPPRQCEVCGSAYQPTYSQQRTCGRACGQVLRHGARRPAVQLALVVVCCPCSAVFCTTDPQRLRCDDCRARSGYLPVPDAERGCSECGALFVALKTGGRRRQYCSDSCRRRATSRRSKVKRGAFVISKRSRLKIYRRDLWCCHLCGCHVRTDTHQPWSATLDHLTPRSKGGTDDPSNLATAHLWCNVVRGTAPLSETWPGRGCPPPERWGRAGQTSAA